MRSLASIILIALPAFARDGTLIGNGGDSVYCRPAEGAELQGFFNLDYLLEYRTSGSRARLVDIASWDESRLRIFRVLSRLAPELARGFDEFAASLFSPNIIRGRAWNARDLREIDLIDEKLTRLVPRNCYPSETASRPVIHQTVVRAYNEGRLDYAFDPAVIDRLTPLQLSFLVVHEWLWDFTENVEALRRLNWLIHSVELESWSPDDLSVFFTDNRFFDRELAPCHRSLSIKSRLSSALRLPCESIKRAELRRLTHLDLSSLELTESLWPGDLSGLYALRSLSLARNSEIFSKVSFRAFESFISLRELDLSHSGVVRLPDWVFDNLGSLESLRLNGNPWLAVEPAMRRLRALRSLAFTLREGFDATSLKNLPSSVQRLEIECKPGAARVEVPRGIAVDWRGCE